MKCHIIHCLFTEYCQCYRQSHESGIDTCKDDLVHTFVIEISDSEHPDKNRSHYSCQYEIYRGKHQHFYRKLQRVRGDLIAAYGIYQHQRKRDVEYQIHKMCLRFAFYESHLAGSESHEYHYKNCRYLDNYFQHFSLSSFLSSPTALSSPVQDYQ